MPMYQYCRPRPPAAIKDAVLRTPAVIEVIQRVRASIDQTII